MFEFYVILAIIVSYVSIVRGRRHEIVLNILMSDVYGSSYSLWYERYGDQGRG